MRSTCHFLWYPTSIKKVRLTWPPTNLTHFLYWFHRDLLCTISVCLVLFLPLQLFAGRASINHEEKGNITLDIKSTGTTCEKANGSILVTASGGVAPYAYSWNDNVPQAHGRFTHLPAGTYHIKVTDAEGSIATALVTLTNTHKSPTSVTAQLEYSGGCAARDASLTLTGVGGTPPYTYSIDQNDYQVSHIFPNLTAGLYYLGVKDANGCLSPKIWYDYLTIPENCEMKQNGLNLSYYCQPFRSNLGLINVSGGKPPYTYSIDGANFQENYLFENLPGGLYTVTVKDADHTKFLYTVALVDRCNPIFAINTAVQLSTCNQNNGVITITPVNGISPYEYAIDGVNFQNSNAFKDLAPGSYTITVKDAENSISSKLVMVGQTCLTVSSQIKNSTCGKNNGSLTFNAAGGVPPYQYSIDGMRFEPTGQFNELLAGTYTVTVKDATGQVSSSSITIEDHPGPAIPSIEVQATGCDNKSGGLYIKSSSTEQPLQYSLDGTRFQSSPDFTGLATGIYNVIVKDEAGCLSKATGTIPYINTLTVEAGKDVSLCEGSGVQLSGVSNGTNLSWYPAIGLSKTVGGHPIAKPSQTTKYYLTVTEGPCSQIDSVTVFVKPAPIPDAGQDITICFGKNAQLNGSGGATYFWSPGTYLNHISKPNPTVIQPTKTMSYQLSVVDANGCSSLIKDTVQVRVTPPASVFAGNDTSLTIGQPFSLHAVDINNSGFNAYTWTPHTGLSNPFIQNPVVTPNQNISYVIRATTQEGCAGTDTIHIKVFLQADIYVPTAFTPNGDGKNDILKAIPVGLHQFHYFKIFNQWGQLVFESTKAHQGWDGKRKGVSKGSDVYVWVASGTDYKGQTIVRKGTVVLIK